jgi:hypothetical protein
LAGVGNLRGRECQPCLYTASADHAKLSVRGLSCRTFVWLLIRRFAMVSTCVITALGSYRNHESRLKRGIIRTGWKIASSAIPAEPINQRSACDKSPATQCAYVPEPRRRATLDSFSWPATIAGGDIVRRVIEWDGLLRRK